MKNQFLFLLLVAALAHPAHSMDRPESWALKLRSLQENQQSLYKARHVLFSKTLF